MLLTEMLNFIRVYHSSIPQYIQLVSSLVTRVVPDNISLTWPVMNLGEKFIVIW